MEKKITLKNFFTLADRNLTEINISIHLTNTDDYEYEASFFDYGFGVLGRLYSKDSHYTIDITGSEYLSFKESNFDNIEEANDYLETLVEMFNRDANNGMIEYQNEENPWDCAADIFKYMCIFILKRS